MRVNEVGVAMIHPIPVAEASQKALPFEFGGRRAGKQTPHPPRYKTRVPPRPAGKRRFGAPAQ
jgi:hypothetical protein